MIKPKKADYYNSSELVGIMSKLGYTEFEQWLETNIYDGNPRASEDDYVWIYTGLTSIKERYEKEKNLDVMEKDIDTVYDLRKYSKLNEMLGLPLDEDAILVKADILGQKYILEKMKKETEKYW
jgi:hypothetical protein